MRRTRRWKWSAKTILIAACVGSGVVHAGLIVVLERIRIAAPKPRLVDAPATQLTLAPAPDLKPAPPQTPTPKQPKPAPPKPEPPKPEPPKPETPKPAPAPDSLLASKPVAKAPQPTAKAAAPASAPAAAPPVPPESESPPPPAVASFAGVQGVRARHIVYVMDGSAAMVTTLPFVEEELIHSISRLDASQSFEVIVFRDPPEAKSGQPLPAIERFSSSGYTQAAPGVRQRVENWVQGIRPAGSSVPLDGLREGLALHPDLIFLLTCSIPRSQAGTWGEGNAATLAALDKLNPPDDLGRRPTVIKTVQLLADDPTGLLQSIAAIHGDGPGSYRVLTLEDLKGQ
ncbi:MAG: hypothetical protein GC200_01790 [Tepidisphaera sp.]|nr:hypothetical protein [Tepidisphaera sp.]